MVAQGAEIATGAKDSWGSRQLIEGDQAWMRDGDFQTETSFLLEELNGTDMGVS